MTALVLLGACGTDSTPAEAVEASDRPTVVVTTNILGDVVTNLVGDAFDVVTIMPIGSDPHDFQPSARQVATIEAARAIIVNGAGFEEGLLDAVEAAESRGTLVFEAMSAIDAIDGGEGHDDHDDDGDHEDEGDHADGDDHEDDGDDHEDNGDHEDDGDGHDDHHDSGSEDPHFFTDPARMAQVVDGIADFLAANVDGVDQSALQASAAQYIDELLRLDDDVEALLAAIPESRRVLVTNHEVFSYFADRYDFEVADTVIPSGSSTDGVSGQRLAELADLLEREAVSVVFADTSSSDVLAQTLAREVGDVEVVTLFSESLGGEDSGGATYVEMVRTNAMRIAEALAS